MHPLHRAEHTLASQAVQHWKQLAVLWEQMLVGASGSKRLIPYLQVEAIGSKWEQMLVS